VLERPKQGFSSALPYMLADEYKQLFSVFLKKSELAKADLLQQNAINQLLGNHLGGKKDNGNRLWLLLNSEVWYRMFIQGVSKDDLALQIAQGN
jgi:asparagine synthase (glutamine-hydrolysing)